MSEQYFGIEGAYYPIEAEFVWFDHELVPFEEAAVEFQTSPATNEFGLFEGIRCYDTPRGPAVIRLTEQMERFLGRIRMLGIEDFEFDVDQLRDIVCRVIQVNRFKECFIRPSLFFEGSLKPDLPTYNLVLGVGAWRLSQRFNREALETGVRLVTSGLDPVPSTVDSNQPASSSRKSHTYQVTTIVEKSGYDEAILLEPDGHVAQVSGENLFSVQNNTLFLTPQEQPLESLTRDTIVALAADAGYAVVEEPISRDKLFNSDELMLCGSAAELLPVCEIDSHPIGDGSPGPATRNLQSLFNETVLGENRRSTGWLDYMVLEPVI